jgi:hypothetical protein
MDKATLSDQQCATLVDSLHPWGLDSSELVAMKPCRNAQNYLAAQSIRTTEILKNSENR